MYPECEFVTCVFKNENLCKILILICLQYLIKKLLINNNMGLCVNYIVTEDKREIVIGNKLRNVILLSSIFHKLIILDYSKTD